MELKDYQRRTLDAFTRWQRQLETARQESLEVTEFYEGRGRPTPKDVRNYPKAAWQKLAETGEVAYSSRAYVTRTAAAGFPIPHVCFKIPTGGGKTLLGAAALERLKLANGLVLWMVPTDAIFRQTKEKLWDRQHPYRDMLERACGGRVKVMEKDDPFTKADVEHHLCVMLISLQSANRKKNPDFLRINRDSGRYLTFFPDNDDPLSNGHLRAKYPDLDPQDFDRPVLHSLLNVIKMVRPVVILDEAHKAYGKQGSHNDEYAQAINRLNPSLVIELSATPSASRSNLLVDVSGSDLQTAEMIKLPIQVSADTNVDWHNTISRAKDKLEELENETVSLKHSEGRYIRPIAVVRAQLTGKDKRDGVRTHADDVREYLTRTLGVPPENVAVQSNTSRELVGVDLLSESTQFRWIITHSALMEGWDCPFAYVLVMLDNTKSMKAVTQLVGRVMRQPDARRTGREALDQCYVYCRSPDADLAVRYVKDGLEQEGMGDLHDEVRSSQVTALRPFVIHRRERFRGKEIFLPKVLHRNSDGSLEELDYQRHILPGIDLAAIGPPPLRPAHGGQPQEVTVAVGLGQEGVSSSPYNPRELDVDESVRIAWYARHLSAVMPNPFQAARIVLDMIKRLREAGLDDHAIYLQREQFASQLQEHISNEIERQAEKFFLSELAAGTIRFDLLATDQNLRLRHSYDLLLAENDRRLERYGEAVQLSLFEPVYEREFNGLERRFAFYLDEQKALAWWHRVAVRQGGEYYLRGWRQQNVWPDFVAMGGETKGKPSVLVFETKGEQLVGNDDTEYKRRLFSALEQAFNAGKMTIHDGPAKGAFRLVFDQVGFPDAQEAINKVSGPYKTP